MKAAVSRSFGPPDVVTVADVPRPEPRGDEILVRVRAAAVGVVDGLARRGSPWYADYLPRLHPDVRDYFEYVFNGDPWQPDQNLAPIVNVTSQGTNHTLLLSYSHNRNATDVTLTYESSTDLATWTPTSYALITAVVTSSETEEVTVNFFPTSARAYFVRVRASRNSIEATHPAKQRTTRKKYVRNG